MAYKDTILADSPWSYVTLDEATGTFANIGVVTPYGPVANGAGITRGVAGIPNGSNCVTFSTGNTSWVSIPQSNSPLTDNRWTIEAWVKTTAGALDRPITVYGPGGRGFKLGINASNKAYLTSTDNNGSYTITSTGVSLNDGKWHHLVGVANSTTGYTLYVDTVATTGTGATGSQSATPDYIYVGGLQAAGAFNGSIDEVALYDAALTSTQVAAHYAAGQAAATVVTGVIFGANATSGTHTVTISGTKATVIAPVASATATSGSHGLSVPATVVGTTMDSTALTDAPRVDARRTVTLTRNVLADTWVGSAAPDTAHGNDTGAKTGPSDFALLTFDTLSSIPADAVVKSATVTTNYGNVLLGSSANATWYAYQVTSPWGEYQVTWNSKPTMAATAGGSSAGANDRRVDITGIINRWIAGDANYGIALKSSWDGADIATREHPTQKPATLVVTYEVDNVSGTVFANVDAPLASANADTGNNKVGGLTKSRYDARVLSLSPSDFYPENESFSADTVWTKLDDLGVFNADKTDPAYRTSSNAWALAGEFDTGTRMRNNFYAGNISDVPTPTGAVSTWEAWFDGLTDGRGLHHDEFNFTLIRTGRLSLILATGNALSDTHEFFSSNVTNTLWLHSADKTGGTWTKLLTFSNASNATQDLKDNFQLVRGYSGNGYTMDGTKVIGATAWTHVAMTITASTSSSQVQVFVNGVKIATTQVDDSGAHSPNYFGIGGVYYSTTTNQFGNTTTTNHYTADYDRFISKPAMYSKVLTDADIASNFTFGSRLGNSVSINAPSMDAFGGFVSSINIAGSVMDATGDTVSPQVSAGSGGLVKPAAFVANASMGTPEVKGQFDYSRGIYYPQVMSDHPLGYWKLDEASGTVGADEIAGHNAVVDPSVSSWRESTFPGDSRNAALAVRNGRAASIAGLPAFSADGSYTVEVWARYDTLVGLPTAIRRDGSNNIQQLIIRARGLNQASSAGMYEVYVGGQTIIGSLPGGQKVDNQWHHLAISASGTTLKFYVDGVLQGTASNVATTMGPESPIKLGSGIDNDPQGVEFMNGAVDEVAIYDYELSPTRIAAHARAGQAGTVNIAAPAATATANLPGGYMGYPAQITAQADMYANAETLVVSTFTGKSPNIKAPVMDATASVFAPWGPGRTAEVVVPPMTAVADLSVIHKATEVQAVVASATAAVFSPREAIHLAPTDFAVFVETLELAVFIEGGIR